MDIFDRPPRRWLPAMEAEIVKQRMARALKNCRDLSSATARAACYIAADGIEPEDIADFDLSAAHIEGERRRAFCQETRLSFGERAAGILLVPVGMAIVGLMSLADDAEAKSKKASDFVDALDSGWGYGPMIFFIVCMVLVGALVLWKEPEDRR